MNRIVFEWQTLDAFPALYPDGEDFVSDNAEFTNNLKSEPVLLYTPSFDMKFQVGRLVACTVRDLDDKNDQPTFCRYWMTEDDEVFESDIKAWAYLPELSEIERVFGK